MGTWHGTLGEWVIPGQTSTSRASGGNVLICCVIDLLDQDGEWARNWVFVLTLLLSQPSQAAGASLCPAMMPSSCPSFPVLAAPLSQGGFWGTVVAHPNEDEDVGVHQPHLLLLCKFAVSPGLKVCIGATEVIKHRSSFCCSWINPVLKYNFKRLKILLTEINFSWRTFDLRDSSFHFQIHYPILNYGFYYKSLFLHSL